MTTKEKHLQQLFRHLSDDDQHALIGFAEFLASRAKMQPADQLPVTPQLLPRPPKESVIAAIKRLSQSYPMLDKATMLDSTSNLMTDHVLHGKEAAQVIDELERLFRETYATLIAQNKQ